MISAGSGFSPAAGGMINYYHGLLAAMCDQPSVERIVAFVSPWNDGFGLPDHPKIDAVACPRLPRRRTARVLYEQSVLGLLARRSGVDVLLCTSNVMPLVRRGPTVVVLQSIQYFLWPEEVGRGRRAYLHHVVPRSLRRADVVIAVTETERNDALGLFGLDPERIATVHHGASDWAREAVARRADIVPHVRPDGRPYLLMVSRLYGFKNHTRQIEAFAALVKEERVPHDLLIAGGDADVTATELRALASRLGVENRVHTLGPVPQAEIPGLFAGADAMAYASLYETFGHPVLEAFAFGLPLLTSSVGATAEIAGRAARLVDPSDTEALREGLHAVLTDDDLRRRLSASGPRRFAEFTWGDCAQATVRVLRHAVASRSGPAPEWDVDGVPERSLR